MLNIKALALLSVTFLTWGYSDPEKIEMPKQLVMDWSKPAIVSAHDITYVQLNFSPFVQKEIMGKSLEELMFKDSSYTLDSTDKIKLTEFISDSSNFSYGDCGTFALNGGFVLSQNDTIKGIIEMGCGFYQWSFAPWNKNTLDGSLSEEGFKLMTQMLDGLNLKMKKEKQATATPKPH